MIANLFPPGMVGTATSLFELAINDFKQGNPAGAQAAANQLWAFTLQAYNKGLLTGAGTPAGAQATAAFGNAVFCNIGLTVNLNPNLNDNVVAIVPPNTDTTIRTGTSHAGVRIFASQGLPQELVVITRLPDNAHTPSCQQYSGPLCTPLAQFPPFYEYDMTPAPNLANGVPLFITEECPDTSLRVPPAQLFLAHNVQGDTAAILPHADPGVNLNLTCDGGLAAAPRPSLFELARHGKVGGLLSELAGRLSDFAVKDAYALVTGGVTGRNGSWSPFGIVDDSDLVAYQNGGWTYHAPTLATTPPPPGTGDIAHFEQPSFVPDQTWVVNTSPFGNSPFGSGDEGFNCTLSLLPNLNKVWPTFNPVPTSTGNLNTDSSSIFLLRKTFFLPSNWSQDLKVGIAVDNDVEVFVNGTPLTTSGGSLAFFNHEGCAAQDSFLIDVPVALLNTGPKASNLLAIRARDRGGESYIDARLSPVIPPPPSP